MRRPDNNGSHDTSDPLDFSRLFDGEPVTCPAKQKITPTAGGDTDVVLYLLHGYVAEQTIDRFNGITTHAIHGPHDTVILCVAESNRLSRPCYSALTNCQYLVQPTRTFFRRATQTQEYGIELIGKLLYQLQVAHERTENLSLKYATDRVAYRLLFFAERFGSRRGTSIEIQLPLTHQLLASTVNLSRERVSQVMYKLGQSGYLSYGRKRVTVLNMAALEQLVAPGEKSASTS